MYLQVKDRVSGVVCGVSGPLDPAAALAPPSGMGAKDEVVDLRDVTEPSGANPDTRTHTHRFVQSHTHAPTQVRLLTFRSSIKYMCSFSQEEVSDRIMKSRVGGERERTGD